jgi:diadenosine tetraphosphate (Ap4A) HIT family hydrolase
MNTAASPTAIHRIVERCRAADYPPMIARLRSGWAVMGERQVFPGYCLLLPDPVVGHLNELSPPARAQFLSDMGLMGDALLACTAALRVNYAMLGNLEPALHAHLFPRHAREPAATRSTHPWALDWNLAPAYGEEFCGELKRRIAAEIASRSPSGAEQVMPLHR